MHATHYKGSLPIPSLVECGRNIRVAPPYYNFCSMSGDPASKPASQLVSLDNFRSGVLSLSLSLSPSRYEDCACGRGRREYVCACDVVCTYTYNAMVTLQRVCHSPMFLNEFMIQVACNGPKWATPVQTCLHHLRVRFKSHQQSRGMASPSSAVLLIYSSLLSRSPPSRFRAEIAGN